MSGWLVVAGLGPGADELVTPQVSKALAEATDIVGYGPYVERVPPRDNLVRHITDNRQEIERAKHALQLAAGGHRVVIVSSGDPGVFAMASALYEAVDGGDPRWQSLDIRILPGISAMLAASAAAGAPLGHDFCCINLSDNLKPWELIEKRLRLAAEADFAMAFYNPRSKARPEGFARTLDVLRETCGDNRIIIFARAVSMTDQTIRVTTLGDAEPEMADMRTLVIVGSSQTCVIDGNDRDWVYTPRSVL